MSETKKVEVTPEQWAEIFDWDDVDGLRADADYLEKLFDDGIRGQHPLHKLADRIAALLPPREEEKE